MEPRLYILVLGNLTPGECVAQACHAVAAFMIEYPGVYKNTTIVCLRIGTERFTYIWDDWYAPMCTHVSIWREPTKGNIITAVACMTADTKLFKSLPLIGE